MNLIEFHDVSHQNILHRVNGYFREGNVTTFVGPSGAGKTTCLKHINRLLSPDAGTILYRGENIDHLDVLNLRRNIGMAFQSAPMIPGTVYDNLNLPKAIFDETLERNHAIDLLERVELDETFLDQPVKSLSGGEASRVAIARTLVNRPDVLLLDEITASLDNRTAKEIERLILKLNARDGVTVIWVTHDLDQARRVSDDVWFLQGGELLAFGDASFLDETEDPVIQQFVKGETS